MHSSVRCERNTCTDKLGQFLSIGDYVMDMSFTVTRGRVRPPGRCYKLTYNPVKLAKPHAFYKRIGPREELLLNSSYRIPLWLTIRIVQQIIQRIHIEHSPCAEAESARWQHTLNDSIIQLLTHQVGIPEAGRPTGLSQLVKEGRMGSAEKPAAVCSHRQTGRSAAAHSSPAASAPGGSS